MATIELGPGGHFSDSALTGRSIGLRRVLFPAVRWGAVLAGVAVGISVQLVLTLLGIASGLSSIDVTQNEGVSATGPLIWAAISMLISAFVGGYVAARMSGLKRKVDGILHGAVSWAVTTLLFAVLATSVSGSLLSGIFHTMAPNMATSVGNGNSAVTSLLRGQAGNLDARTLQRLQSDLQAGRRDDAIALLADSTGMDRTRATTIVDQALIVSGSPEQASPASRQAADRAVQAAGTTAWMVFLAVALSLALGLLGGALGALSARRTSWAGTSTPERESPSPT